MKLLFCNSYIMPHADYCCTIWGHTYKKYLKRITGVQKRSARIVLQAPRTANSRGLFMELKWLPFEQRHDYYTGILVYKSMHNMTPKYLQDLIDIRYNQSYNLRSNSAKCLTIVQPKTNYLQNSFRSTSANIWNNIPTDIKLAGTLQTFKYQYKKQLLLSLNRTS